jgi:hypothetical protein
LTEVGALTALKIKLKVVEQEVDFLLRLQPGNRKTLKSAKLLLKVAFTRTKPENLQ